MDIDKLIKNKAIHQLQEQMKEDLDGIGSSFESTKAVSQSEDFKQESKYDTRAIEAGYLAGAQKARLELLENEYEFICSLSIDDNVDDIVRPYSFVVVEGERNNYFLYFLVSISGARVIDTSIGPCKVISTKSPIGLALNSLEVGDEFEFKNKRYNIVGVK